MKNWKKFFITTIGTFSIIGTTAFASTGTVNAPSGLVLRKSASKNGEALATVPDKTEIEILEDGKEWYKVKYNNQDGYLFKEYVNKTEDEKIPTTTQENEKISVYIIPVITSSVISEIDGNQKINVIKQITNWSYIIAGNTQGWVRTAKLSGEITPTSPAEENQNEAEIVNKEETKQDESIKNVEQNEPEKTYTEPSNNANLEEKASTISKAFVDVEYANVRKNASTNSEIITTLTKDTSFSVIAETEEWYKIKYIGLDETVYEGYIYKELTKPANN